MSTGFNTRIQNFPTFHISQLVHVSFLNSHRAKIAKIYSYFVFKKQNGQKERGKKEKR